jgi:stage IV sporulation protein A
VITSDGSYGELAREAFVQAEEMAIKELKQIEKPFIVIVNSVKPYALETQALCRQLENSYDVKCLSFNCDQLKKEDIQSMMSTMLLEFPVSQMDFYTPKWFDLLPEDHPVKSSVADVARKYLLNVKHLKDVRAMQEQLSCPYIKKYFIETISMSDGRVVLHLDIDQKYYYELLSELLGTEINGDYAFFRILRQLSETQEDCRAVSQAVTSAKLKGYGVVAPKKEDVTLESPVLIKHGNRYGFKIKATAPSIHMIKAGIETEIAPIVGDQAQAEELIASMNASQQDNPQAIWETLIFGKTVGQLVEEGIQTKVSRMSEGSQQKMQEAIQKIINDGNGGVIFIII